MMNSIVPKYSLFHHGLVKYYVEVVTNLAMSVIFYYTSRIGIDKIYKPMSCKY